MAKHLSTRTLCIVFGCMLTLGPHGDAATTATSTGQRRTITTDNTTSTQGSTLAVTTDINEDNSTSAMSQGINGTESYLEDTTSEITHDISNETWTTNEEVGNTSESFSSNSSTSTALTEGMTTAEEIQQSDSNTLYSVDFTRPEDPCSISPCFQRNDCEEIDNGIGFKCIAALNTWASFRDREYIVVTETETWMKAEERCLHKWKGVSLASITSPQVQQFINRIIPKPSYYQGLYASDDTRLPEFWIGLHRDSTGKWKWDYNQRYITWANWEAGEPDRVNDKRATLYASRDSLDRLPHTYTWYGRRGTQGQPGVLGRPGETSGNSESGDHTAWYICMRTFDSCASSPCLNNGRCKTAKDRYHCECLEGYIGRICEAPLASLDDDFGAFSGACSARVRISQHVTVLVMTSLLQLLGWFSPGTTV